MPTTGWMSTSTPRSPGNGRRPRDDLLTGLIAAEDAGDMLTDERALVAGRAAVHRRPRDDGEPHRERNARAAAEPGCVRTTAQRSRSRRARRGRAVAVRQPGAVLGPNGAPGFRDVRGRGARGLGGDAVSRLGQSRPAAMGRQRRVPGSDAAWTRAKQCRSAAECTTVSDPRSRGWKVRLRSVALVRRFPQMELATDTPKWNGRMVLRGLDELPVTLG